MPWDRWAVVQPQGSTSSRFLPQVGKVRTHPARRRLHAVTQLQWLPNLRPYRVPSAPRRIGSKNVPLVLFIDNNACRNVLISAKGRLPLMRKLLAHCLRLEHKVEYTPCVVRVPSPSNCADAPSKPPAQIVFLFGWGSFSFWSSNSGDVGRCHGRWRGCYPSAGL